MEERREGRKEKGKEGMEKGRAEGIRNDEDRLKEGQICQQISVKTQKNLPRLLLRMMNHIWRRHTPYRHNLTSHAI